MKGPDMGMEKKKNAIPAKLLAADQTDEATRADVADQVKSLTGIDA